MRTCLEKSIDEHNGKKVLGLKCCVLAVGDFPEGGATSQRLHLLTKILNNSLGKTSLWIINPASKSQVQENKLTAGEWDGVEFCYLNGSTVRPVDIVGALTDTVKGIYNSVKLLARCGKERPDVLVVYTPTFMHFIIPVLTAKFLGIPVIFELCEIFSKSTDRGKMGLLRRIANSGDVLMERLVPRVSAGLLVISKGIRKHYEDLGLSKDTSYLLPVLIDIERYKKGGNSVVENLKGKRFLLNSGSFSEKDGLSHVLKAMATVHQEYPEIKLVFTGSAPKLTQEKILKDAGPDGEDWIIFAGFLSRDELIWCYKNAIGLLSCRSNSEYANLGFPTKLAEYLGSARPVIATTVGDVEEYLTNGKNAFLAKPEDADSIASAILALLKDPDRAELIGRNGAEVALDHFDYRNHIDGVASFIRRRIRNNP